MALTPVVYAPGIQVQSTNLNDIQDEIIADESRITALEAPVSQTFRVHASATAGQVACAWQNITSRYWQSTGAPAELVMPLHVEVGASITAWSMDIRDTASQVTAQLYKATANGAPVALGAAQASAGSTSDQLLAHTLVTPEIVIATTYYYVQAGMPAIGMRVYGGSFSRTL